MRQLGYAAALILTACIPATAAATEEDVGAWAIFSASGAIGDQDAGRWKYWFDLQERHFDIGSGANQQFVRPGVGYSLSDTLTAWGGYARVETRSRSGSTAQENRLWQQLVWRARYSPTATLETRILLEERSVSIGQDTGYALHLRVGYLGDMGAARRHRLSLFVEPVFDLHDTDWAGSAGLRQVRLYAGWRIPISGAWAIETGYLQQNIHSDRTGDLRNHIAIVSLRLRP